MKKLIIVALVAGTNNTIQRILSIDGNTVVVPPTKASVSNDMFLKLAVPATGTNSFLWATNSPPVVGFAPSASSNLPVVFYIVSDPGSSNVYIRRPR